MAPEQARDSRATSIQSDMYSLGCTFYYLLAGVPPFPGGDITDKLTRHAKNPPPEIRDLRPDLPAELSAMLLKLMAKRPEDRFASYDELTAALDAVPLAGGTEPPGITFWRRFPILRSLRRQGYDFDATHVHKTRRTAQQWFGRRRRFRWYRWPSWRPKTFRRRAREHSCDAARLAGTAGSASPHA